MSANDSAVPKFASFQRNKTDPKEKTVTLPPPSPERRGGRGTRAGYEAEGRKRKQTTASTPPNRATSRERLAKDDLFFSDRKGDVGNARHDMNQRSNIPLYKSYHCRAPLGTTGAMRVENHSERRNIFSDPLSSKASLRTLQSSKERYIRPSSSPSKRDREVDFVPIRSKKTGPSPKSESNDLDLSGSSSTHSDDEDEENTNGQLCEPASELTVGKQNAWLAQKVSMDPEDVNAWLEYIRHQDKVVSLGFSETRFDARQTTAEIKFEIYEKALTRAGKSTQSRHTLLRSMASEDFFECSTISKDRLQRIVNSNKDCPEIFRAYLDHCQAHCFEFGFESCHRVHQEYFQVLRDAPSTPSEKAHAVLRLAHFFRDAGYQERAIAIWKALFDINLFRPRYLQSRSEKEAEYSEYEDLWDSEHLRIGESSLPAWSAIATAAVNRDTKTGNAATSSASFGKWAKAELGASQRPQRPAEIADAEDSQALFRIVLFADIREFLLDFTEYNELLELVNAFLAFNQLPPLPPTGQYQILGRTVDPFIVNGLENIDNNDDAIFAPQNYLSTAENLFNDANRRFEPIITSQRKNIGPHDINVDVDFVGNVLEKLVLALPYCDELAELYLAFLVKISPKKARTVAKNMIKQQPSNLRRYNSFALVETQRGAVEAADNVFSNAIRMHNDAEPGQKMNLAYLWRSWLWDAIRTGDDFKIRQRIHRAAEQSGMEMQSNISNIRDAHHGIFDDEISEPHGLFQALTLWRNQCIERKAYVEAATFAEVYALTKFFATPNTIGDAITIFEAEFDVFSSLCGQRSVPVELLYQGLVELLNLRLRNRGSFEPALVKASLKKGLTTFPDNTMLLGLRESLRSHFSVGERVSSLDLDDGQDQSIIAWLLQISGEIQRSSHTGGSQHLVRSAFENALRGKSKVNVSIWKMYILFEHSLGNRRQAKEIFHRGMLHCLALQAYLPGNGGVAVD